MILIILIILIIILIIIFFNKNIQNFTNNLTYLQRKSKIAFMFLIKDGINKEDLWNKFFSNIDKDKYNIYIHYKNDIKLKYLNRYKLSNTVPTKWGDISLVYAQKLLLKEALKDTTNYKFIFLSDACIPIKNFDYIYDFLTNDNSSYFNTEIIKDTDISKTFQWCILNREHSNIINRDTTEIKKYIDKYAPDEIYFLTTLRRNKANNIIINEKANEYTTYVNWGNKFLNLISLDDFNNSYKNFKSKKTKTITSPYTYTEIDNNELAYLVNKTNCLFFRKVLPDTIIDESLLPY